MSKYLKLIISGFIKLLFARKYNFCLFVQLHIHIAEQILASIYHNVFEHRTFNKLPNL